MDDVNVYGTSDHPPPLISPKNVVSIDNNGEDNLTKFYDDVPKSQTNNADCNGFDSDDNASGCEIDGNFVDNDNEFGQDDDDLFEDSVHSDVEDRMVQYKGKKVNAEEVKDKDFDMREELEMPNSDNEEEKMKFNFQVLNSEVDIAEPKVQGWDDFCYYRRSQESNYRVQHQGKSSN